MVEQLTAEQRAEVVGYLNQYRDLEYRRRRIAVEIQKVYEDIDIAQSLDGQPRKNEPGHPTSSAALRIIAQKKRLEAELEYCTLKRGEISLELNKIGDPIICEILAYRFLNGMKWREIYDKIYYSGAYIYELHKKGLTLLYKILKEDGLI